MAGVQVVSRKMVIFQGVEQEFTNVYNFGDGALGGTSTDIATRRDLGRAVINAEKLICNSDIKFYGFTTYELGPLGGPVGSSSDIVEFAPTESGSHAIPSNTYYECAVDIKLFITRNRYLRTMIHTGGANGLPVTGALGNNADAETLAFANKMLDGDWPGGFERIAPNGDRPTRVQVAKSLEHRQFHRYKRRTD